MSENNHNSFKGTVESLFSGMDSFLSSKTVVGDAIHVGDTVILPLVDVSFGIGAGNFNSREKGVNDSGAGGMGAKLQPSAVLVVSGGSIKLVNIKNQDSVTKILDMVPELVDKVTDGIKNKKGKTDPSSEDRIKEKAAEELNGMINDSVEKAGE